MNIDPVSLTYVGLLISTAGLILGAVSLILTVKYNKNQKDVNRAVMAGINKEFERQKFIKNKKMEMIKNNNINIDGKDLYGSNVNININIGENSNDNE